MIQFLCIVISQIQCKGVRYIEQDAAVVTGHYSIRIDVHLNREILLQQILKRSQVTIVLETGTVA